MIFLLLFVFLGGCLNQAGSLVLTSSPMTATDGELLILICSGNTTGGQDRQWVRDGTLLFTTTQGYQSPSVANPDVFNRYLSGRVNVSCDARQHNVTLRISSVVDNGSRWQCLDNPSSQRSNTVTINVIVTETTPSPTSDYLNRTSATIFTTTTNNNTNNNIHGIPISTSGSTAATAITTTIINPAGESTSPGQSNTIAIVAGAAGGGVAVIAIVIVVGVCITKSLSAEENIRDKTRLDRNPSRSAEMLIENGVTGGDEKVMMDNIIYTSSSEVVPAEYSIQGHNQADKVMQDNILYTSSSDIAPTDYSTEDPNRVGKDVYSEVKKVKTNADQHEVTDMYAKPHQGRKETPNGDVYAKVNKEKSREGKSENMEDMYAKPQKGKRNPKRNPDAD